MNSFRKGLNEERQNAGGRIPVSSSPMPLARGRLIRVEKARVRYRVDNQAVVVRYGSRRTGSVFPRYGSSAGNHGWLNDRPSFIPVNDRWAGPRQYVRIIQTA